MSTRLVYYFYYAEKYDTSSNTLYYLNGVYEAPGELHPKEILSAIVTYIEAQVGIGYIVKSFNRT